MQKIFEKDMDAIFLIISVPGPFYRFQDKKYNLAITHQIQVEFWGWKVKGEFS